MDKQTVIIIKAFHYLTTPLGATLFLLTLAVIMMLLGKHKLKSIMVYCSLLFLWFCATPVTSNWLVGQYISLSNVSEQCPERLCTYDAIIVAGYMKPYTIGDPKLNQYWSERLWHAKNYYKENTPIIVISSQYPTPPEPRNGELSYAKQTLMNWGVNSNDIIITKAARTTREAMMHAYSELIKHDKKNSLLVGYKLRLPRKLNSIRKLESEQKRGFKFISTLANNSISHQQLSPKTFSNWLPSENSLLVSRHVLHEIAGLIAYKVGNWI